MSSNMKSRMLLFAVAMLDAEAVRVKTMRPQNGYTKLADYEERAPVNRTTGGMVEGAPCSCSGVNWANNKCCGEGLICSRKDKVCKPAIGGKCTKKAFGTNCAKGSYGEGHNAIGCHKFHGTKEKRCCISGLASLIEPGTALFQLLTSLSR